MATPRGGFNRFPAMASQLRSDSDRVVRAAAFNINERIQGSFEGSKSGRIYKVAGRTHVASAPGEAPAVLFGTFRNSTHVAHPKKGQAIVYSNDEKGPYLEFGTRHMAPRPSFQPAAEAERGPFNRAMQVVLGRLR